MHLFPKQIYSTSKLILKNAYIKKVMDTNFVQRWKEFSKLYGDEFVKESAIFTPKQNVDPARYKGLRGVWNRFGANSRITLDKWNGTLQKALDKWVTHLTNMGSRGTDVKDLQK